MWIYLFRFVTLIPMENLIFFLIFAGIEVSLADSWLLGSGFLWLWGIGNEFNPFRDTCLEMVCCLPPPPRSVLPPTVCVAVIVSVALWMLRAVSDLVWVMGKCWAIDLSPYKQAFLFSVLLMFPGLAVEKAAWKPFFRVTRWLVKTSGTPGQSSHSDLICRKAQE